jgi:cell division protein FtsL
MSTIAQSARTRPRARARARARAKPQLLGGGVLWIVFFAVLLAGVVAVNVAVLRLNVQLDGVGRERTELKADIAGLRAELSSASASARIERLAQDELGLEPADPDTMVYVELGRK